MALNSRSRGRVSILAAAVLTFGGLVAAAPASADATPAPDALAWGFKESFRNYVGRQSFAVPPIGALPEGERIHVQAPAQFDTSAEPTFPGSSSSPNETLPYLFPVASVAVTDAQNLSIATAGGATYNFPSHFFTITVSNVEVVIEGGVARVEADLDVVVTGSFEEFDEGEHHEDDVHLADVADVEVAEVGGVLTVTGSGLTLTSEGAAFLPYAAGDPLDDLAVSVLPTPAVEISRSQFAVDGASTVTVTGRGFYHGNAVGTRPPLAGKPAGAYVAVGYFPEVWRPSVDPRAARPAVSAADGGQKWAVPAESIPAPVSPSAGGIELAPDGSFSTELTVDKAVIDAAAEGRVTQGSYGIYTYPGSGAVSPSFETFSPIEFIAAPAVTTAPKSASLVVGSTATFGSTVTGADSLQWQSRKGSAAWRDVAGATTRTLKVATTAVSQSGTQYRLVATNAVGTATSGAARLTVKKASPKVSVSVKKSFRFASKRKATVKVTAPKGVSANGAVVVKSGKTIVGKGTVRNGKATVTLSKKLRPGTARLVAEYRGNANVSSSRSASVKVKVAKAKAKVTAKLTKSKIKVGKRGTLRVKVTASGVKPSGKVKVAITKGKKKVRTVTVRVKGGQYTKVRLPKLAKGTYSLKASYQGSSTVAKKSAKKVTLRVR